MARLRRRPTPKELAKLSPYLEGLVRRLFESDDQVFFERPQVAPERLEAFLTSDEVLEATFDYVEELVGVWQTRRYGKPLKVMARKQGVGPVVEKAVMPDFSGEPASPQAESGSSPATTKEAPAMPKTDPAEPGRAPASAGKDAPAPRHPTRQTGLQPGQVPPAGAAVQKLPEPKASFTLPNAKVGVAYDHKILGRDAQGRPVRVLEAQIPDALGLTFDTERGTLRGTPALDGDHRIPLRWTLDGAAVHSDDCLLIVNPDPKSLWKVIEPPDGAPYPKSHTDATLIAGEGLSIVAASRRGRSHEHAGSFRDDDFHVRHDPESGWSLILVADGAGSARFSRQGSRIAVATAGEHLFASLKGDVGERMTAALNGWDADPASTGQAMGQEFHYLFHKAGQLAVHAIEREAQAQGVEPRDYATTLLAAAVKRQDEGTFLATFWMGDGAIAAYGPRGKVRLMGTPDGGEFAGQTRFLDRAALSDQGFAKRIGIGRYQDLSAILLMTDGVSDPRFETDKGLNDPAKWDSLWGEIAPLLETPEPAQQLADWLAFFSPGHHDDRTIALLW
ncbi:protein phosphatase 2C domain-containing protein [Thiorhodococcus mannitoliphagus]|uniref:Protein phosphatase 2C domain-containing protein n=1 Tax=Thiorhodococcus mannitoliphagus TaxID=329406 RepID=A0A6P1DQF0_9GAMM|nr:PP2C family serine/threonine-protein phosphatase [Thiorhodococcus mannitoliphagus]NEX19151.1 protein phosphatase 2C domain-containing protein [Thiorhodococcus mannitoliphagus]